MHFKLCLISASVAVSLWAQAPADPDRRVVATIGGKDLTAAEIGEILKTLDPRAVQAYNENPQLILNQYFLFHSLTDEAEKAQLLDKSPYKEQFEGLRRQFLYNARVNEENNTFPVTNETIEAYHAQHGAQFEQARIKVIYLPFSSQEAATGTSPDDLKALAQAALAGAHAKRTEAQARALAEDLVKQLRAGADFAKLVEQYSEDPDSKAKGGDFAIIKATGEYPADLKSAVFALKPGEISDPVRQPTAYYLVRLEEKGLQPIEEVRGAIVEELRKDHMNQWMKEQTARFDVVIKDPDFFKAPTPPPFTPIVAPPKQ